MELSIYSYTDYRAYLKAFYKFFKEDNYFFSYRYMADRIGIDHSCLVKVFNSARHLPDHSIDKVALFCKLDSREQDYFNAMVQFAKSTSDSDIKLWYERMLTLKTVTYQNIEDRQYRYFQSWIHAAVRSALDLRSYSEEYDQLAKSIRPPISLSQAKESVELLLELGMIERNDDGVLQNAKRHLSTPASWSSVAIRHYQKECIQLSLDAIQRFTQEKRDISTITMSIPKSKLDEIKALSEEFRQAVVARVNDMEQPDSVYQLNIQFFPLAEVEGDL